MAGTSENGAEILDQVEAELQSTYVPMFRKMLKEIKSKRVRDLLESLGAAKSPQDLESRAERFLRGSAREQAMVYASAVTGAVSGHMLGSHWPMKIGGRVPAGSIVGLGGMLTSLLAKTFAGRTALGVGGLMFAVGAYLGAS